MIQMGASTPIHHPPVTPARLRSILRTLHWTAAALAMEARVDERTVRRWSAGQYPVPASLTPWLETLAAFHEEHPCPAPVPKKILHCASFSP